MNYTFFPGISPLLALRHWFRSKRNVGKDCSCIWFLAVSFQFIVNFTFNSVIFSELRAWILSFLLPNPLSMGWFLVFPVIGLIRTPRLWIQTVYFMFLILLFLDSRSIDKTIVWFVCCNSCCILFPLMPNVLKRVILCMLNFDSFFVCLSVGILFTLFFIFYSDSILLLEHYQNRQLFYSMRISYLILTCNAKFKFIFFCSTLFIYSTLIQLILH